MVPVSRTYRGGGIGGREEIVHGVIHSKALQTARKKGGAKTSRGALVFSKNTKENLENIKDVLTLRTLKNPGKQKSPQHRKKKKTRNKNTKKQKHQGKEGTGQGRARFHVPISSRRNKLTLQEKTSKRSWRLFSGAASEPPLLFHSLSFFPRVCKPWFPNRGWRFPTKQRLN